MADPAVNPIGAAPVAIAHIVLRRYQAAREEKNSALKDDMSLMKLIKIAYAAHGYHLAFYNTPLVRQRIEAGQTARSSATFSTAPRRFLAIRARAAVA